MQSMTHLELATGAALRMPDEPGLRPEPKNPTDHKTHEKHEREEPRMNADERESRYGLRTI